MNFNQVETLLAVADAGSFSKAANVMGVSPQSLMQQVASVEKELGFEVLQRDNRGVSPTAAGAVFVEQERQVLAAHRTAVENAQAAANRATTLRVGMPLAVNPAFLLGVAERFGREYPSVAVVPVTRKRSEMPRALANGEVDVYMDIGRLDAMPYVAEELFPVEQYCVVSRADPLAALGRVDPELLAGRALAVWESPERYDVLAKTLGCTPENLRNLHRDLSAALSFCMGGGTLVTSIPVVQMLKSTLAVAPLDLDCRIVYAAVHAPGDNPLVGAFVDCARAVAASGDNPWKHATPHASDDKSWPRA